MIRRVLPATRAVVIPIASFGVLTRRGVVKGPRDFPEPLATLPSDVVAGSWLECRLGLVDRRLQFSAAEQVLALDL